ncbi:MAG: MerR family transcriptional regulator [Caulobacteraceae bacterium]|nr:MerR family transcriptional regulator [Caulobacteraceae bacterium]
MTASTRFLSPSEAGRRLGVSPKALRLYEERGLVSPARTEAGWRAYGPAEVMRAAEVAALRALGFSLRQVKQALEGDTRGLEPALAAHQARIEAQLGQLSDVAQRVRRLREDLAQGNAPKIGELARLVAPAAEPIVAFDLPWPWGGERFELREIRALNYIVGPLGSGKTRLAKRLAETVPRAAFLELDRTAEGGAAAAADPALAARCEATLAWLTEEGATACDALTALVAALEADESSVLVIDVIEHGLDEATQEAIVAHLRRRGPAARPLFILTRSSAILDLAAVGPDEAIILCPANHSPPTLVAATPGAPGYEAVATCLAEPAVRARTEGMIAWRPSAA